MSTSGNELVDPASLYKRIGEALVTVAPSGWRELHTVFRQAGRTAEDQSYALMQDGSKVWLRGVPKESPKAFRALRQLFYQQGKGAWFTAYCTVHADGRLEFDFDYEEEPEWNLDIVPASFIEDLEMFPRDEAQQPEWLRDKVRQGRGSGE